MGCPEIYYKRSLQTLSYNLAYDGNIKLAKELLEEESDEKLKKFILNKKKEMDDKYFYYAAGQAVMSVLEEAYDECTDSLNASIGGITSFEYFIGIRDIKEDDKD